MSPRSAPTSPGRAPDKVDHFQPRPARPPRSAASVTSRYRRKTPRPAHCPTRRPGLPAGLSISSSTGVISGTATTAGTSAVTVTGTDSTGPDRVGHVHLDRRLGSGGGNTVTVTNPGSQAEQSHRRQRPDHRRPTPPPARPWPTAPPGCPRACRSAPPPASSPAPRPPRAPPRHGHRHRRRRRQRHRRLHLDDRLGGGRLRRAAADSERRVPVRLISPWTASSGVLASASSSHPSYPSSDALPGLAGRLQRGPHRHPRPDRQHPRHLHQRASSATGSRRTPPSPARPRKRRTPSSSTS